MDCYCTMDVHETAGFGAWPSKLGGTPISFIRDQLNVSDRQGPPDDLLRLHCSCGMSTRSYIQETVLRPARHQRACDRWDGSG